MGPHQRPLTAMRDFRLSSLKLSNFKGCRAFTLEPNGRDVSAFGDNATFKTTLFDAYTWLMCNKDSANRKDFDIKTRDEAGQPLHGLEHEVEGVFSVGGRRLVLRKVYAEQWTKRRGSAERQFTGHSTAYFVDGVPVSQSDYETRVATIADERTFRLLSDPGYFNEVLHWQERRRLLLEVCGDISDADVIASDPALAGLTRILGQHTLDDYRKILAVSRAKVNKEIEQIPIRVSEVKRGLPDVAGLDRQAAAAQLADARTKRQAKLQQLALAENGGAVAEKGRQLAEISNRMAEIEIGYRRKADQAYSARLRKLQDAQAAVATAERELRNVTADGEEAQRRAQALAGKIEELRTQFRAAADAKLVHTDATACPTCGQALPEQMVADARAKALEQFNLDRSRRLERINAEGKLLKAQREQAEAAVQACQAKRAEIEGCLPALRQAVTEAQAEADRLRASESGAGDDPEYRRLAEERAATEAEIARLRAGGAAETSGLREEIAALEQLVAAAERVISQVEQHARGTARIAELKAEEQRLAAEFERLERELYLTEEFIRCKVRLLTDRINSRFEFARFRLFDVQVNGGLVETCETTFGGVPYSTALNRGARIAVGLDIIRTLSQHFGLRVPVFLDNAEAVTRLPEMDCQVIRLYVSAKDKSLRVELDPTDIREAV